MSSSTTREPGASPTPSGCPPSGPSDRLTDGLTVNAAACARFPKLPPDDVLARSDRYRAGTVNALCPNCGEADGDVTERTDDHEFGLQIRLSCPACDHDWSVTL